MPTFRLSSVDVERVHFAEKTKRTAQNKFTSEFF